MDWNVIVPAATAIIGIVIGFLLNLWRDTILNNRELKQKELESQRDFNEKYIIMPIITAIDNVLMMMERYYMSGLNNEQVDTGKLYESVNPVPTILLVQEPGATDRVAHPERCGIYLYYV